MVHDPHEMLGEARHLFTFGAGARLSQGGFGWMDTRGVPLRGHPRPLYVTCRMTHTFALGALLGVAGAGELADHGIAALRELFADAGHGGWFTALEGDSPEPADAAKWAYPHAFVILAASSATMAGRPHAQGLLAEALAVFDRHFWDSAARMPVEEWNRDFTTSAGYRGANAAMHSVEGLLAAADATGDAEWAERAAQISGRIITQAEQHGWRLPEHYDVAWQPRLAHNREHKEDPFKPYGATPGHAFEWARLLLHVESSGAGAGLDLLGASQSLFGTAVDEAWAPDGTDGLIYTVDWDGTPVIRQRLHWVQCEALAAATVLHQRTGEAGFGQWSERLWHYIGEHHLDREHGSWHHELDEALRPSARVRPGKADIYHAVQALLLPSLPPRASIARAVKEADGLRLPAQQPERKRRHAQAPSASA